VSDHGFFLARLGARHPPQQRVVELADVLERFLSFVVMPSHRHVINLFAAQAELASAAAA